MYNELSETSKQEQLHHAALLQRFEAQKRARQIAVPTGDDEVRRMLRGLGHPVRVFGESLADVRERLREVLARIEIEGEERDLVAALLAQSSNQPTGPPTSNQQQGGKRDKDKTPQEDVYTAASAVLVTRRRRMAAWSFERAKKRLATQRRERDEAEASARKEARAKECGLGLKKVRLALSQFGDARPVCRVRTSKVPFNGATVVATGSWSGRVCLWDASTFDELHSLRCSEDRVTGLDWSPTHADLLAVGLADGQAQLWRNFLRDDDDDDDKISSDAPSTTLDGHKLRLGAVLFHPLGDTVVTTSFDTTWRLWDVETGAELLLQDGHAAECYAAACHPDGGLVSVGDFAGVVVCWDLRAGKKTHTLTGHSGKVLCADFNSDGYRLATGSDDHAVRIWDLRRAVSDYVLPAHSALVADLRFAPGHGEALATAAFDGTIGLWSARDFSSLVSAPLAGHDGKCMSLDFLPPHHPGHPGLVSAGFDRTLKLWCAAPTTTSSE